MEIIEKLQRFKIKAEEYLKSNLQVFIIDINDTYYFAEILFVGEKYLIIQDFKGFRKDQKTKLLWADIIKIEPYQPKESEVSFNE